MNRFVRFFVVTTLDFHGGHEGTGFRRRNDGGSAPAGPEVTKASGSFFLTYLTVFQVIFFEIYESALEVSLSLMFFKFSFFNF